MTLNTVLSGSQFPPLCKMDPPVIVIYCYIYIVIFVFKSLSFFHMEISYFE